MKLVTFGWSNRHHHSIIVRCISGATVAHSVKSLYWQNPSMLQIHFRDARVSVPILISSKNYCLCGEKKESCWPLADNITTSGGREKLDRTLPRTGSAIMRKRMARAIMHPLVLLFLLLDAVLPVVARLTPKTTTATTTTSTSTMKTKGTTIRYTDIGMNILRHTYLFGTNWQYEKKESYWP